MNIELKRDMFLIVKGRVGRLIRPRRHGWTQNLEIIMEDNDGVFATVLGYGWLLRESADGNHTYLIESGLPVRKATIKEVAQARKNGIL